MDSVWAIHTRNATEAIAVGRLCSGAARAVTTPSDSEVIAASREDAERFGLIFERHYSRVCAYLQRRVGPDEADELAAETFVRAFRARARYDLGHEDARPWLFGIATNLLRHHWRGERRRLRALARTGIDPVTTATEEAEERVSAAGAAPALARALLALGRGEREVLLLHAWAELTHKEIALALEISPATVRSRLSKARAHMKGTLFAERESKGREQMNEPTGAER